MSMGIADIFWLDTLHDFKINQPIPLPFDRYRLSDEHRHGRGISIAFDFDEDLTHDFLAYASSNKIALEHLALASYYGFLFKLTNGERDLCTGMNTTGRYREELMAMIGMFENIIPLRCQLDPHWSFHHLIEHVREIMTTSLEHSYFPLQRILARYPNVSKSTFLGTFFEFQSNLTDNNKNEVMISDARLCPMLVSNKISEDGILSTFDFTLTIQHDSNSKNQLTCTINASLDLFNMETVHKIAQRFHSMLEQLFIYTNKPIYEFSLILPVDRVLVQSLNNTQVLFPTGTCIHHEFIYQVMKHPQKLAVELDDQYLTYSELLYYAQLLSLNLLNNYHLILGEIVCQYVERSLSMVS